MSDATDMTPLVTAIQRIADAPLGLDVSADLTVTVDGHELQVEAYTDRVFVDFPSLGVMVDLLRSAPGGSGVSGSAGGSLPAALAAADLTAVARIESREVATLGAEADGPLRHLGYGNVAVSPAALALAGLGL
jgi:pantoate kinase